MPEDGREEATFYKASLETNSPFSPIFPESGIVVCVHDLVWPRNMGQSLDLHLLTSKLKNWKSFKESCVAYHIKRKNSSITDKWDVKWLTSSWTSLTSNDLTTEKFGTYVFCISKKAEHFSILYVTNFLFLWIIRPLMTLIDL